MTPATSTSTIRAIVAQEKTAKRYEARVLAFRWVWVLLLCSAPFAITGVLQNLANSHKGGVERMAETNPFGPGPMLNNAHVVAPGTPTVTPTPVLAGFTPEPNYTRDAKPPTDMFPIPKGSIVGTMVVLRATPTHGP